MRYLALGTGRARLGPTYIYGPFPRLDSLPHERVLTREASSPPIWPRRRPNVGGSSSSTPTGPRPEGRHRQAGHVLAGATAKSTRVTEDAVRLLDCEGLSRSAGFLS